MPTPSAGSWRRFFQPSLLDSLLLVVFVGAIAPVIDFDLWFHLKTGERIWETRSVPRADPFSFGAEGRPWTAHSWLPELLFHGLEKGFGVESIAVVKAAMVALGFHLTFLRIRRRGVASLAAALLLIPGIVASMSNWVPRPLVFSFPLLAGFLLLLDSGSRKVVWASPLLLWIWANTHGSFILGILLLGVYAGGDLLLRARGRLERPDLLRARALALGLSIVACALTPYGPDHLLYPFLYHPGSSHYRYIEEWRSTNFHTDHFFEALLLLALAGFAFSGKKPGLRDFLLMLLWLHLALGARRLHAYFVLGSLPVIGEAVVLSVRRAWEALPFDRSPRLRVFERHRRGIFGLDEGARRRLGPVVVAVLAVVLCAAPGVRGKIVRPDWTGYPLKAVNYLAGADLGKGARNCFTVYHFGGYFLHELYPRYRPFVDGRMDLFDGEAIEDYRKAAYSPTPAYAEVFRRRNVEVVLWPTETTLAWFLERDLENWERMDFDRKGFSVFRRRK